MTIESIVNWKVQGNPESCVYWTHTKNYSQIDIMEKENGFRVRVTDDYTRSFSPRTTIGTYPEFETAYNVAVEFAQANRDGFKPATMPV